MVAVGARRGPDCVDVLLAGAENGVAPACPARSDERPKFFWLDLAGTPGASWEVDVSRPGHYRIEVGLRAPAAHVTVLVDGSAKASTEVHAEEWELIDLGLVELPLGSHVLEVRLKAVGTDSCEIRSVELVHVEELAGLAERLATFRQAGARTRNRLKASPFGVMFQYGPWSYSLDGPDRPGIDQFADSFDVEGFADRMVEVGAGHVIWSLTWWTYELAAPSAVVDRIVGHSDATSRRDLIAEIGGALKARGIMFFLYYHLGHDAHLSYDSSPWWRAQRWPAEFSRTGHGDRGVALRNAVEVLTDLGRRYSTMLDGWFLDDGMVYYPTEFEALAGALRTGNPERLVAYNSWILPRVTDFQDVEFGEGRRGLRGAEVDDDGYLVAGPNAGLLAHAMTPLQSAWGIYEADQRAELDDWAGPGLEQLVAATRGVSHLVPLTLVLLMWTPGEIDPAALSRLAALRPDRVGCGGVQ